VDRKLAEQAVEGKTVEEMIAMIEDMMAHPEKSLRYASAEELIDTYIKMAGGLAAYDLQSRLMKKDLEVKPEVLLILAEKKASLIFIEKEMCRRAVENLDMPNRDKVDMEYVTKFLQDN
jgi:hypothetical protein